MKIVCDACQTKYSIADDRVAGKVFKIRCKKCSQIIVVRGIAAAEPVEPAAVPAGEWHVVIDGQQSGPFDRAELVRRHTAGELDDESFVWRDGMEEWAAFASIAELAGETDRAPVAGSPSAGAADAHEAMFATRSAEASAAVVAPAGDDKKLLAERNENSVLFTLGNLAKLASDARPAKDAAPAKPGAAGEGSGLIDIRALASTFAKPAAAKASTAVGSLDDLPTFGPTTFGEPIVLMPSARPKTDRRMLYALFAALAMLAIMAAVLLVVVFRGSNEAQASKDADRRVATLGTGDPRSDGTATGSADSTASGSPAGSKTSGSTTSGSTSGSPASGSTASGSTSASGSTDSVSGSPASGSTASGSTAASGTATASQSGSTPSGSTTTRPSTSSTRPSTSSSTRPSTSSARPSTSSSTSSTRPSTSSTSTRPTTTPTTSSTAGKPDRIQCEFSGFTDKGCEIYKPATSTTAASNLPENLDRAAIAAGLGTIKAQGCGNRSSSRGDVSVQIKVNADGGVSGVTVKSSPDPALSSCVVAAAQKGTFAKTKRGASFGYVWRF